MSVTSVYAQIVTALANHLEGTDVTCYGLEDLPQRVSDAVTPCIFPDLEGGVTLTMDEDSFESQVYWNNFKVAFRYYQTPRGLGPVQPMLVSVVKGMDTVRTALATAAGNDEFTFEMSGVKFGPPRDFVHLDGGNVLGFQFLIIGQESQGE